MVVVYKAGAFNMRNVSTIYGSNRSVCVTDKYLIAYPKPSTIHPSRKGIETTTYWSFFLESISLCWAL